MLIRTKDWDIGGEAWLTAPGVETTNEVGSEVRSKLREGLGRGFRPKEV